MDSIGKTFVKNRDIENICPSKTTKYQDFENQRTVLTPKSSQQNAPVLQEKDQNIVPFSQYSFERRCDLPIMGFNTKEFSSLREGQDLSMTVNRHHKSNNDEGETPFTTLSPMNGGKHRNSTVGFKKPTLAAAYVENNTILRSESPQSGWIKYSANAEPKKLDFPSSCPGSPLHSKRNPSRPISPNNYLSRTSQQPWTNFSCHKSPSNGRQQGSPKVMQIREQEKSLNLTLNSLGTLNSPTEKVPGKIYPIIRLLSPSSGMAGGDAKKSEQFGFPPQNQFKSCSYTQQQPASFAETYEPIFQKPETRDLTKPHSLIEQDYSLKQDHREHQQAGEISKFSSGQKNEQPEEKYYHTVFTESVEKVESPKTAEEVSVLIEQLSDDEGKEKGEKLEEQTSGRAESTQSATEKENLSELDSGPRFEKENEIFISTFQPSVGNHLEIESQEPRFKTIPDNSERIEEKHIEEDDFSISIKSDVSSRNPLDSSLNTPSESLISKRVREVSARAEAKSEYFRKKLKEIQDNSKLRLTALLTSNPKLLEEAHASHEFDPESEISSAKGSIEEVKHARPIYSSAGARKDIDWNMTRQHVREIGQNALVYPETPELSVVESENGENRLQTHQSNDLDL